MKRLVALVALVGILIAPLAVATAAPAPTVNLFPGTSCGSGSAAGTGTPTVCTDIQKGQGSTQNPIVGVISQVIQVLAYVIGVASVIGLVISGIRLATANGDSSGIATARTSIIYCLVGVAVAVLAQVIVSLVLSNL